MLWPLFHSETCARCIWTANILLCLHRRHAGYRPPKEARGRRQLALPCAQQAGLCWMRPRNLQSPWFRQRQNMLLLVCAWTYLCASRSPSKAWPPWFSPWGKEGSVEISAFSAAVSPNMSSKSKSPVNFRVWSSWDILASLPRGIKPNMLFENYLKCLLACKEFVFTDDMRWFGAWEFI